MKRIAILTALCTLACSSVISNELPSKEKEDGVRKPNRLYFGPEILYARGHFHRHHFDVFSGFFSSEKIRTSDLEAGLRVGYEYLRPKSFYCGIDALYALGNTNIKSLYRSTGEMEARFEGDFSSAVANVDARAGYNFPCGKKLLFSPFLGVGGYRFHMEGIRSSSDVTQSWIYGSLGLRTSYRLNPTVDLGLNLKLMSPFYYESRFQGQKHSEFSKEWDFGYEVGMPMTKYFGSAQRWNIQFEPYFLRLDTKRDENIVGGRITSGYRF